jgi:uncharacterized protein (TIGR03118 family)
MKKVLRKVLFGLLSGLLATIGGPSVLLAQQSTAYTQTNLAANVSGVANHTDSQLTNPWGIAFTPGAPFWTSNNNSGTSTLYDAQGNKQTLVVTIPGASTNPCHPGCPTGIVANSSTNFNGGLFIFDTEDGLIADWTGANSAVIAADNSASGAVYKGLELINNGSGAFLLAANFNSGQVDVFDHNFAPATLAGSFVDPNLPAGFAPHGIRLINNHVWVTYAQQNAAKHDAAPGAGVGIVDVFDVDGNFVKRFATGGTLNAPWGMVATPAAFGTFSSDILIGNFGDGTINAFDTTGKFLGQVSDTSGKAIVNPGIWDLVFGAGGTGDPNTLYFTAGGSSQTSGLFASLIPAAAATHGDFSLSISSQSATVGAGQSTTLKISASAVGGFNAPISLSCTTVTGVTCALSQATITPGSSAASSTLTLTAAAAPPSGGYGSPYAMMMWLPLSSLGVFGMVLGKGSRKAMSKGMRRALGIAALSLLALGMMLTVGCGGSSSSSNHQATNNMVTLMVKGTSGSITHSTPITLTIR